ncbi:EthD family reductase, partial [Mammaliicoccus sciuri]
MAHMLVIYRTPKDPKAFDEHYFNVHVPLAKQLPGLI